MKTTHPTHRMAWPMIGLAVSGFLLLGTLIAEAAPPQAFELPIREIEVSLDRIDENIDVIEGLLLSAEERYGGTDRMREIQSHLHEMESETAVLDRIVTGWGHAGINRDSLTEFRAALDHLGEIANLLQQMLSPQGISRVQEMLDLTEIRFAMNRIIEAIGQLKRLTDPALPPSPEEVQDVSISMLYSALRHAIVDVELAQSASQSISPEAARPELLEQVSTLIGHAAQNLSRFESMLKPLGQQIPGGGERLELMARSTGAIISALDQLRQSLPPSRADAPLRWSAEELMSALDPIYDNLQDLRRALRSLSAIPNGASEDPMAQLARFDQDGDCLIGNEEFSSALEMWISAEIDRDLFGALIDAWVMELDICVSSQSAKASRPFGITSLAVTALATSSGWSFGLQGADVVHPHLEIFDAGGRKIAMQAATGRRLSWNLRSADGRPVANGLYFYRVVAETRSGQLVSSPIKKLAVFR